MTYMLGLLLAFLGGALAEDSNRLSAEASCCIVGASLVQTQTQTSKVPNVANKPAQAIKAVLSDVQDTGLVNWTTLVLFDGTFEPVFRCWAAHLLRSVSRSPLAAVCLDADACGGADAWFHAWGSQLPAGSRRIGVGDLVENSQGVSLLAGDFSPRSYSAWFFTAVQKILAQRGAGVLHSDLDAMWIENPDTLLEHAVHRYPSADIVSQVRRGGLTRQAEKAWGFELNAGFILFQSTGPVLRMFEQELVPQMGREGPEQKVLNEHLLRRGCRWSADAEGFHVGTCGDMQVIGLPEQDVGYPGRFVSHPFLGHSRIPGYPLIPGEHHPVQQLMSVGLCSEADFQH